MSVDPQVIEKLKEAGRISSTCLHFGATLIKPGVSMREVLDAVEEKIVAMGGGIAFPAQVAVNDVAAHYCPTLEDDYLFKEGDMCKLDIGVHVDGYIADNALTVDLGDNQALCDASLDALEAALAIVKPGVTLGELGRVIQETIQKKGFSPIRNLSGHGLGRFKVHTSPSVPNFDTGDDTPLPLGATIAIEPFATSGAGVIFESSNPTIFSLVASRPSRSPITRSVLKTIQSFAGLPFATRWLEREHGVGKTRFALRELDRLGNLLAHPPLPDRDGGLVSQHEHSVLVLDEPLVYTRLQE